MPASENQKLSLAQIKTLRKLRLAQCHEAVYYLKNRITELSLENERKAEIDELKLTKRAYNALKSQEIRSVNDIIHFGLDRVKKIRNVGEKTKQEIENVVHMYTTQQQTANG